MKKLEDSIKRERNRIHEIAGEYEARGYKVTIKPKGNDLPSFLSSFQPDMLAISETDKVVIEVKTKNTLQWSRNLINLARVIEEHDGWRFEFALTNPKDKPDALAQLLSTNELHKRVEDARQIFENGQQDSGMLLLWIAAEATLKYLAVRQDIDLNVLESPRLLIKTLFSLGILEKQDFETLDRAAQLRNRFVHGYTTDQPITSIFRKTEKIVARLLDSLPMS